MQKSLDDANSQLGVTNEQLKVEDKELREQAILLKLVNATVGDLGTLNQLSGGRKYFVRIAAGTSKQRLEKYLNDIDATFKGAKSSGLVSIRDPIPPSRLYKLVFGSGLDLAAADVFQRMANSNNFPPIGKNNVREIAEIELEPMP